MMKRPIPKTLRGQLVLVILATFLVVQGISLWLFMDERRLAVRAAQGLEAAGRAANMVRLLEAAPEDIHPDILRAADSPLVRFFLTSEATVDHLDHNIGGDISTLIHGFLEDDSPREVRVELHQIQAPQFSNGVDPGMERMHQQMMGLDLSSVEMQLSIALDDGQWLNVSTRFHRPPIQFPWLSTLSYGLAALIVMITVWVALSRLTGPLRKLAGAAEKLGRGETVARLPDHGPEELRIVTVAFNRMQDRLTRFVSERTRMLAALGHDLRSPLTAMRLRTEMVEDKETRERLEVIISEMQEMVDSTLSFARGMVTSEETQSVDLAELLEDLVSDIKASLGDVDFSVPRGLQIRVKRVAMRRALRNVIENAVRYGTSAKVSAKASGDVIKIYITDQGPGIPEAELERVFDPFVRVEKSRNMETGGTGLGLSIARTVIQAHGGDITLNNQSNGGLVATIILPIEPTETLPE